MKHANLIAGLAVMMGAAGAPASALAQIDLSGVWAPIMHEDQIERVPGPDVGDYAGLPINAAMRLRADTWDASLLTLPEHQCKPHPSTYGFRGVGNLRIAFEFDDPSQRLLKINTQIQWMEQKREIWMDGRPPPPEYAAHTWQGFSTGRWEGPVLVVRTTHLKAGWIRRNGLLLSDRATMEERFLRHGDLLTHVYMISDPVYLTEPLIRTNGFRLQLNGVVQPYPCETVDEVVRAKGVVPSHLPGTNRGSEDFAAKHRVPVDGVRGGAETALPEFIKRPAPAGLSPSPPASLPVAANYDDIQIHSLHVQGNVWMLVGGPFNAAASIGDEGVLMVDTMPEPLADKLLAEVRRLAGNKPIRYIINTHSHPDHTGGNAKFAEAGESIVAGNFAAQVGAAAADLSTIIAHENTYLRLTELRPPPPFAALPTNTFFTDAKDIFFNGEAVQILHQPGGHTDGDVIVFFRKSDVIVAGDVYINTTFPVIQARDNGTFQGQIVGVNRIIDLTVPREKQEGGTYVIPGHGRLADEADVVEYRDMNTILRDRVQDAIGKGMTLTQIKAARPVSDYEGRYGASTGFWTTENFIDAVYRSLSQSPAARQTRQ